MKLTNFKSLALLLALAGGIECLSGAEPLVRSPATRPAGPTRAQIDAMIEKAGKTLPEWWDSVPVNYPSTLDLSWPDKPGGGWNPQKNVGQYLWDVINPNPGRWKEGIKLLHHIMEVSDDDEVVDKAIDGMSHIYAEMLHDYPRAAYWARKTDNTPIRLATCYWKMGSKEMAVEVLRAEGSDYTRYGSIIRLWGEMGEMPTALKLAQEMARDGYPDAAYLVMGDLCRAAGQYQQAAKYYRDVLACTKGGRDIKRIKERAQASLDGLRIIDLNRIADGVFTASSLGYAGPVQVAVTVADHRLTSVKVTQHKEKQFYSSIEQTTSQIIEKQGVRGVDTTSGATITSEAIINATVKALTAPQK